MPSMSWFVHGLADAKEQAKKSKAATLPTTIAVKSGEFGGCRAAFIPTPWKGGRGSPRHLCSQILPCFFFTSTKNGHDVSFKMKPEH